MARALSNRKNKFCARERDRCRLVSTVNVFTCLEYKNMDCGTSFRTKSPQMCLCDATAARNLKLAELVRTENVVVMANFTKRERHQFRRAADVSVTFSGIIERMTQDLTLCFASEQNMTTEQSDDRSSNMSIHWAMAGLGTRALINRCQSSFRKKNETITQKLLHNYRNQRIDALRPASAIHPVLNGEEEADRD